MSGETTIRWSAWIDGPRGLVIAGALKFKGLDYELCAHVDKSRRHLSCGHYSSLRHQAMRQIRSELREEVEST
mgnify:CR=1 FL=1